ncbi:ankyrin repeat domain-containing protein [Bauldia sp.]|uniref:ankyrin repeat domain-containing protein n=1 Tax=Bauldia sp. TaxID=2575872 RepID=UPI003BAAA73E
MPRILATLTAAGLILAPLSAFAETSLESIVRSGDVSALKAALETGADVNEVFGTYDTSALMLAAIRGDTAMVAALLDAGADPDWVNQRGASALSAVARSCSAGWDVAAVLLDAGADIENRSGAALTPLMVAIQEERPTFVAGFLEHGADVNALNAYGEGALNYAIYYEQPDFITALLDRGAATEPLKLLFTTGVYYYPNFGNARPHAVDCAI